MQGERQNINSPVAEKNDVLKMITSFSATPRKDGVPMSNFTPAWIKKGFFNESLFCDDFLSTHQLLYSNGAFFTPEGRVTDTMNLRCEIFDMLRDHIGANIAKRVNNVVDVLKLAAQVDDFPPVTDRIALANGTLYLDGTFQGGKPEIVRNRLPVKYDPKAAQPVHWLRFLSDLLYPEDIPTVQEFIGYTLVDGHNRYAILQKHPEICFSTMPLRFANREEALTWICKNQLGRRNLSPEQKRYLLGKQYESEKKAEKIFHGNQYTLAKKSGGSHDDTHHSGKKTCDRIAEENGVSRASVLRARHYTKGIDIADTLAPGIKKKVFSGEVKFTNDEMTKLVQSSPDKRQDVFAEIMHPEITKAMEAADAEPNADNPVPMPTADPEQFKTYQVPDEFMRVYKTLSTATEMMKNTWKRVLKNNQSYLSDPEKQKVLRFAMQRPALYLNELEACMEQILAETLEEAEKTA